MRRILTFIILLATFIIFNQSCSFDKCHETIKYQIYTPVYMTKAQLKEISIEEPKPLKNPGKIYVYNNYLFINEMYEGIHIYDNSDKSNPINLSFISIIGNIDIAVKDDILYAENYLDLLSFDISNPENPVYLNSVENLFNTFEKTQKRHLIYYKPTNTFREIDCSEIDFGKRYYYLDNGDLVYSNFEKNNSQNINSANIGLGGSMARFTILNNRLYIVDKKKLNVINIDNPRSPFSVNTVNIGWGIETIFPYEDNLFIGSNTGMFVYSASNPDFPSLLSSFRHARSCDPVYVVGNLAYVTLRSGTRCQGFSNQLDIINIENILKPKLIKSYQMENPHGLSIINNKLILCEGEFGLKVLDIKDSKSVRIKTTLKNKDFYDVIGISENHILLIGNDGLYQYKLNEFELQELSSIKVEN